MSPSIPFNSPFMPLSCSRCARFIFHVCPFLSPVISLHLPSCPLVSLSFLTFSVCIFPLHVPFSSPSFLFHSPLLSCHVNFPSPACPCISLYFLPSFPCTSLHVALSPLHLSEKQMFCPTFLPNRCHRVFQIFRPKEAENPEPAKSRQGVSSLGPLFCDTGPRSLFLVEHHHITTRYPPPPRSGAGGGGAGKGGVILYPLLSIQHASAMSADSNGHRSNIFLGRIQHGSFMGTEWGPSRPFRANSDCHWAAF